MTKLKDISGYEDVIKREIISSSKWIGEKLIFHIHGPEICFDISEDEIKALIYRDHQRYVDVVRQRDIEDIYNKESIPQAERTEIVVDTEALAKEIDIALADREAFKEKAMASKIRPPIPRMGIFIANHLSTNLTKFVKLREGKE